MQFQSSYPASIRTIIIGQQIPRLLPSPGKHNFVYMRLPKATVARLLGHDRCPLRLLAALLATIWFATSAQGKDGPVTAIALFDGPSGPAYVQLAGLMVNGKSELRICDGVPKINKTAYDNLLRTQLAGATALERGGDGTLMLATGSKSVCVVPSNLKFERNAEFTPAEAAEQATIQGTVISSSVPGNEPPPFKRGVRLVFVAAADDEFAQYLLAQRANSIAGWHDFVLRHASSLRVPDAKDSLAAIYEESAKAAFAKYQQSVSGASADIVALKQAQHQALEANKIVAGHPAASRLRAQINKELDTLIEPDQAKLQIFRKALTEHTAGYAGLVSAKQHVDALLTVNPEYAPVLNLHTEITGEVRKLESAVQQAEALVATKEYDQAIQALGPYHAFAGEAPRINSVVTAAYAFHFHRGRQLSAEHNWEKAVAEFRRALEIKRDSPEANAALKDAEAEFAAVRDREAVQRALATSRDYADNKDFIAAYETLAELPEIQRALVADQITALQKDFVPAASRRAQKLQEIHIPIRGRADEEAVQEAYALLNRASNLSGDPALKLKLDLLSDKISAYYVDQAKRYLSKPLSSGVTIGWLYLGEAERYKPDLSTVRDIRAQYAAAYQLRSKLSIGVVLRDQTSRRDNPGFADQLADAIATGLESSGLGVKVVRQPKEGAGGVQPNFLLVGEILEHRVVKDANLETLQSKYRAGTHDVKNEEWSKANDDYLAAQKALQGAQRALPDAHGKKEAAAANDAVTAAQKNLDDARHKLDTTEPTRTQAVIESYNYTKKDIDVTAVVELAFHLSDLQGNVTESVVPIKKENHKRFVVLENVKPEDTEGVKAQGTEPDEVRFLTDAEIQARDALVNSVREKALVLPGKVLQEARNKAQQNNVDGAAEEYILYLNATQDAASPEREEATKFLHEHYNVAVANQQQLAASK